MDKKNNKTQTDKPETYVRNFQIDWDGNNFTIEIFNGQGDADDSWEIENPDTRRAIFELVKKILSEK